ncbi:pali-domain-containing protein [Xylariomycetidae sp. FL2044]|nr:pali-domain-containing protein [Xylariomycetidae sp. FL2044]
MRQTGFFHHIGTFLLFSATVLLVITCISAPVVSDISLLKVDLDDRNSTLVAENRHPQITFGTFGYCVKDTSTSGQNPCSPSQVGYHATSLIESHVRGTSFSHYASSTADALTRVMILHPVAAALAFLAFLMALGAGVLGSLLASLTALLAFLVTLVALVCDFVAFSIIRSEVNDNENLGTGDASRATWGAAIWTALAAAICALLGTVVVFFTCCSARLRRRRERTVVKEPGFVEGGGAATTTTGTTPAGRRRWWRA